MALSWFLNEVFAELKAPRPSTPFRKSAIVFLFLFPCLVLTVALSQPGDSAKYMFLDTITAAEFAPECCKVYFGSLSNIGILMWTGTAAACLVVGLALFAQERASSATWFALSAGIFTGWLALDDMFLLHERVLPVLGISQAAVISAYILLAALYLTLNWRFLLRQEWWILALGCALMAASIIVDQIFHSVDAWFVYIEDSAKLFGITAWMVFHLLALLGVLSARLK